MEAIIFDEMSKNFNEMIINTRFWENKDNVLIFSNAKAWKNIR